MNFIKTAIDGVFIIEPRIFTDERGYFFESYSKKAFEEAGLHYDFVQDNQSKSSYGTVRGLHFQKGEHSQAKPPPTDNMWPSSFPLRTTDSS